MPKEDWMLKLLTKARTDSLVVITIPFCAGCEEYDVKVKPIMLTIKFEYEDKEYKGIVLFLCEKCLKCDPKELCKKVAFWLKTGTAKIHI